MLRPEDQFHSGIVVSDLESALERFSGLGYRFARVMERDATIRMAHGEVTVWLRVTYSLAPGPLLEVIEQAPGSPWMPVADGGIHHLGFWSDDVAAESAALDAAGIRLEAAGVGPDGGMPFVYHRDEGGLRIELVDRAIKPGIDAWTTTGIRPQPPGGFPETMRPRT